MNWRKNPCWCTFLVGGIPRGGTNIGPKRGTRGKKNKKKNKKEEKEKKRRRK
jgi:hypothetical protein